MSDEQHLLMDDRLAREETAMDMEEQLTASQPADGRDGPRYAH
jgi:hypothetical protein